MKNIEEIVEGLEDVLSKEDLNVLKDNLKPVSSLSKYARDRGINLMKVCILQNISMAELNDMYQESVRVFDNFILEVL